VTGPTITLLELAAHLEAEAARAALSSPLVEPGSPAALYVEGQAAGLRAAARTLRRMSAIGITLEPDA
jgi:hypothetical protein